MNINTPRKIIVSLFALIMAFAIYQGRTTFQLRPVHAQVQIANISVIATNTNLQQINVLRRYGIPAIQPNFSVIITDKDVPDVAYPPLSSIRGYLVNIYFGNEHLSKQVESAGRRVTVVTWNEDIIGPIRVVVSPITDDAPGTVSTTTL